MLLDGSTVMWGCEASSSSWSSWTRKNNIGSGRSRHARFDPSRERMTPDYARGVQRARHRRVDHFPMLEGYELLTPSFVWFWLVCSHCVSVEDPHHARHSFSTAAEREIVRSFGETLFLSAPNGSVALEVFFQSRRSTRPPGKSACPPRGDPGRGSGRAHQERGDPCREGMTQIMFCAWLEKRMPGTISHSGTAPLATRWLIFVLYCTRKLADTCIGLQSTLVYTACGGCWFWSRVFCCGSAFRTAVAERRQSCACTLRLSTRISRYNG